MDKSIKILIGIGGVIIFSIIMLIIFGNKSETFTVSFYTDGGSKVEFQWVKSGESASRPTDPTKEGYVFDDWYIGNDIYDFSSKVNKDITLYAKWRESNGEDDVIAKKIVVTFDSDGGSEVESQTIEENGTINQPTNPTKKNYQFVSWQLDGEDFDFDSKLTSDITLVAKWKKSTVDENEDEENDVTETSKKFTVTFNTNGGNSIASKQVPEGTKVTKPTDPTKSGYTFKGWYYNDTVFDFNTNITDNITLAAKWEENSVVSYKVEETDSFVGQVVIFVLKDGIKVEGYVDIELADGTIKKDVLIEKSGRQINKDKYISIRNARVK